MPRTTPTHPRPYVGFTNVARSEDSPLLDFLRTKITTMRNSAQPKTAPTMIHVIESAAEALLPWEPAAAMRRKYAVDVVVLENDDVVEVTVESDVVSDVTVVDVVVVEETVDVVT